MKIEAAPSFFESLEKLGSWKNKYYEIRAWLKYHFNKNFFKLLKVVLKSYPWDEGYLYDIEKAKIEEMCKYHQKTQMFVGWEYVVRDMKICMKLIDIFMEKEDKLPFHYSGDITFGKLDDGSYTMGHTGDFSYHCDVKVNIRNAERFLKPGLSEQNKNYWLSRPHEIRILKAKRLYHKIREENDGAWWV